MPIDLNVTAEYNKRITKRTAMLIRLAAASIGLALVACTPAQVDKVCTINVKTQKSINGRDFKPETEAKTVVLTINEQSSIVSFNDVLYTGKEVFNFDGTIHADKRSKSEDADTKTERARSLKYHVKTGVIDFTDTFDFMIKQNRYHEREVVTMNGVCK